MITEHSIVVLNRELPDHGLHAGDVGAVVAIYANRRAYEVEFVDGEGTTIALMTLAPEDVRTIQAGELLHTRQRGGSIG